MDLEYHAAPPKDSKVTEEYQKKRDALRHKVWNVDNLTLANEQAIAREQQREAAETAERQQRNLEQQQKSSAACGDTRKILTARRSVTRTASNINRPGAISARRRLGRAAMLLQHGDRVRFQLIQIDRAAGGAVQNTGAENAALRQIDEVLAAGDPRNADGVGQIVGGKLVIVLLFDPLADRAQGDAGQALRQLLLSWPPGWRRSRLSTSACENSRCANSCDCCR